MAQAKRLRVLIADDSPGVRHSLVALLEALDGMEIVGQAASVHEATAAVDELRPDVAILDIQMPGGSGLDVLAHIRRTQPATRVVIFTNYTYQQLRRRCREAGATFFFDKSTEIEAMIGALRELTRGAAGETESCPTTGGHP
jgi:two-component system response regulator DevR